MNPTPNLSLVTFKGRVAAELAPEELVAEMLVLGGPVKRACMRLATDELPREVVTAKEPIHEPVPKRACPRARTQEAPTRSCKSLSP